MKKWLYFFSKKKGCNKNINILEDIADNILDRLKEKYSPRYFYQRSTKSKSGSFYLIIRKKKRDVQIEKTNLISNVEEIITSAYSFYS